MLALTIRTGEAIVIGHYPTPICVVRLEDTIGGKARLSFDSPREITIDREKIARAKEAAKGAQ